MTEYKEAIRLDPKNATAHYNLAILYLKKKDNTNAIAELRQSAKLSPDWPTPHIMLTNLLKDSDPKAAYSECVVADGLTNDAKLHNLCSDLQKENAVGAIDDGRLPHNARHFSDLRVFFCPTIPKRPSSV